MQVIAKTALLFAVFSFTTFSASEGALAAESTAKASAHAHKANVHKSRVTASKTTHVGTTTVASEKARQLAVQSSAALVVEADAGQEIFKKNADVVTPIASITKLMTAMVVLDSVPNLQAPITISDEDIDFLRGSRSRLQVGSVLTRESALLLALMSSENRAANALARHYPGGMPAFIEAMNAKAHALGMHSTRFEDPTGLTSNNMSTANDLAKMVAAAYHYPLIRELSTTSEASVEVSGREMAYHNTNPLVKSPAWDVGLSKTGYIHEAGKCLVMLARVADRSVVIVLLDSVGKLTRVGDANRIKRWLERAHAEQKLPLRNAALEKILIPG
jgi:D-alanyl-D-alanine endopeptidase (penicillin-binding protein 7)